MATLKKVTIVADDGTILTYEVNNKNSITRFSNDSQKKDVKYPKCDRMGEFILNIKF